MARYNGPKNRMSRRTGQDLGFKTSSVKLTKRLNIPPGQHGRKGSKKLSEFGIQLREKQKVKWIYGVMEKQFRKYVEAAKKDQAATGTQLLKILEMRLDNVVYRLSLAPTRAAARQLVVHGHVKVNERKVDRPSLMVRVGDTISLSPTALKIPAVEESIKNEKFIPKWLSKKAAIGKIVAAPEREDVDAEINENLIIEYYSR